MIRQMLDDLFWQLRSHRGPGQERHYLTQLLRDAMKIEELSIDPRGFWSPRKAERVLEIINAQARAHRLAFRAVDITSFDMPYRRVILVASCVDHHIAVACGEVCKVCTQHVRH